MRKLFFFKASIISLVVLGIGHHATAQAIDDFSFTQSLIFAFGSGSSTSSTILDPAVPSSILGGERDIFVEVVSGSNIVSSIVETGTFSFSTSAGTVGRFYISWDGIDGLGDIADLDHTGLGGEDLTASGNSISLTVNSADIAGDLTFEIFTDATNSSFYTQSFPIINSATTYAIPFTSFSSSGGTGADFTNVGAITLTATGTSLDIITDILQVVLPVEWVGFDVETSRKEALLSWSTATEKDNLGFAVQRSSDGKSWTTIDFVEGSGTTYEQTDYRYTDHNLNTGVYYYRLEQLDQEGNNIYSPVKSAQITATQGNDKVRVYPNPVANELHIENAYDRVVLYNLLGQKVIDHVIQEANMTLSLKGLQAGNYFLRTYSALKESEEHMIWKK